MPQASRRRLPVKRTKTYDGCWTCRARHVKCDGVRPRCNRCAKSRVDCGGYGVRLSWDDDGESRNGGKTRLRFSKDDMLHPVFTQEEIAIALEHVDTDEVGLAGLEAGPYTVFPVAMGSPFVSVSVAVSEKLDSLNWAWKTDNEPFAVSAPAEEIAGDNTVSSLAAPPSKVPIDLSMDNMDCLSGYDQGFADGGHDVEEVVHNSYSTDILLDRGHDRLMPATQTRLTPMLQSFFESSSVEERRLLRFWIVCGSSRMISTGHPDNPYRYIFVPLAMSALSSAKRLTGSSALLHSIYAWAASSMAQLQDPQVAEVTRTQAGNHLQLSLAYLRESLQVLEIEQQGATLAAIVLLTAMDISNGESFKWRIHLRGGRNWLKTISAIWQNNPDNQVIYQVFRGLEIFGYSHDPLLMPSSKEAAGEKELDTTDALEEPFTGCANSPDGEVYCLDRYFGVTKPVLSIIWAIKRMSKSTCGPTLGEIADLEVQLIKANPSIMRFVCPTENIERLTRHHACAFYFACVIAFKRSIQYSHPSDVQYLVEQSLSHLEATRAAEIKMDLTANGLLWPLFVTSAEAADHLLRERCLRMFDFRKSQGVLSVAQSEDVVLEIWRRRDASDNPKYVHRHEVMECLGLDILLA